uniref:P2X purinoceptor 6 n=1 Tax=Papio anubis TaxID=9555 RepID=A0A8I5R5L7_PAPAN
MGSPGATTGWGLLDYKTEKWALLAKKGYQDRDLDPQISVITKLKGVSVTQIEELGNRLWDVADFVKPPQVGALVLLMGAQVLCPLTAWTPAMQPCREKHVMPETAGCSQEGLHRGVAPGQGFQGCVGGFRVEKGAGQEARPGLGVVAHSCNAGTLGG